VPLVYVNPRSVVILEPPSEKTMAERQKIESAKLHAPPSDVHSSSVRGAAQRQTSASKDKAKDESSESTTTPLTTTTTLASNPRTRSLPATAESVIGKRKRAGPPAKKAPNPLSVKKKKPRIPPPPPKKVRNGDLPVDRASKTDTGKGGEDKAAGAKKRKRRKRPKGETETGTTTGGGEGNNADGG
jgi:hypothetical protein